MCLFSFPSFSVLSICMMKLNDFILRNKSAELSATSIFCNLEPGACLGTVQRRRWRGKGTRGKLGWGCVLGYQKASNQSRHTYWDKQKTKTNSHLNIQTKFHTKTKIEEVWHLWENSDQNGWQRIQLLSLPFLWLLSFGFFFFRLRNMKHCGVIFPIYVPFFPIPPPVTFLSFSSGFPSFVLPHSGKEDLPPPAPSGVRSLQSGLTTCSLDCLWKESVSNLHDL